MNVLLAMMDKKDTIFFQTPQSITCEQDISTLEAVVLKGDKLSRLTQGLPLPHGDYHPLVGVRYDLSPYLGTARNDLCLMLNPHEMGSRESILGEGEPIASYILTDEGKFERAVFAGGIMPDVLGGTYERKNDSLVLDTQKANMPELHFQFIHLIQAVLKYTRWGVSEMPNACAGCTSGSCGL
jgi:hypothetical protein